ncbi:MAG: hypothetical protein J6Y29_02130 [Clostridiales bacterium]|nr:hypothetical protein [Clostridiales bacterium]
MARAIKFKNNDYIDTRGIVHNRQILADIIYPVGSIYLCVNDVNPATLFGGTWQKMSGGYLYGCSSSTGNSTYTGSATQSHTLTKDEIPSHNHGTVNGRQSVSWSNGGYYLNTSSGLQVKVESTNTSNTGGGQGHTHNIAYIGVWVWKRTA